MTRRSTHNNRFRSVKNGSPSRAYVLPFAQLGNNPVSCAPNVFRAGLSCCGNSGPGNRTNAALMGRLTLCMAVPSPLRVTTSLPSGCHHFPSTFRFVGSMTIS